MSLVVCHTADWHLGKTLHGASLERAHAAFLDWLVELVVAREVDVLLVAGDVFDRSVPPAAAEQAFYGFLARLGARAPGVSVVVVAGNHDGPARISAPAPLLHRLGVRVIGAVPSGTSGPPGGQAGARPEARLDALVVPLTTRDGAERGQLVAMPFLRPADLSLAVGGEPGGEAVAAARALYAAATRLARARDAGRGGALVACGHGQVRGARLSPESERPLLGGEEASLPLDVFPAEAAYVALGHLHLAQPLEGGRVRYAGAPLPLAFSERDYPHQVVLARFEGAMLAGVEEVRVPRFLSLVRVAGAEGAALDVDGALAVLGALGEARVEQGEVPTETWVQVRVRLDGPRPALKRELATALSGPPPRGIERGGVTGPRLVHVDVERPGRASPAAGAELSWPALSPRAVLERVWAAGSTEALPDALSAALEEAWRDAQAAREERSEP